MNFCQKHNNHHCVHSHSCTNKSHQKLNQLKKHSHNQTLTKLHSHQHPQHKCKFIKRLPLTQHVNKELLTKLHQNQVKICELAHNQTVVNDKCDKVVLENKHLHAQIEYYRQQFASLFSNSNIDSKTQIKKRVQESTDFILKIKMLVCENDSLKVQAQQLRQIVQFYKKKELDHQNKSKVQYEKYENTLSKLKYLSKSKSQIDEQITSKQKNYQKLHDHYEILKAQFSFQRQQLTQSNRQQLQELEIMRKQFNKYKNLHQKEKQLLVIEKESHMKKEQLYKQKLKSFQAVNQELKSKLKDIDQRNEELQQDLKYTRQILHKKQEIKGELTTLNKELQSKGTQIVEKKTYIRQQASHQGHNKQNKSLQASNTNFNQQNLRLREEIKSLSEKILQLESKSMINHEQVIMNIGASQAFKKLVQEKNAVIKKLMRQKGQIYAKMGANYH